MKREEKNALLRRPVLKAAISGKAEGVLREQEERCCRQLHILLRGGWGGHHES